MRPFRIRDFWFFWSLLGDSQVRRYLGGPVGKKTRYRRFKRYLKTSNDVGVWVVVLPESQQPIGMVELSPRQDLRAYEISYQFTPSVWGQGLAVQAVRILITHALEKARIERVIAETQFANVGSCRLLTKCGMLEVERRTKFGAEQVIFST